MLVHNKNGYSDITTYKNTKICMFELRLLHLHEF